jgi:MarR family transcriptional regulator, 2-MHQ and catechol-resistance regulon repressor
MVADQVGEARAEPCPGAGQPHRLLGDDRITALGLFGEAFSGLASRLGAHLAEHGLASVEFEVLLRLARSPGRQLRMTDLSTQTSLTTSGVTRVIDRLAREALVCRRACETDRRASYAFVTDAGLARLDAMLPSHLAMIEQWFTGRLTPDELGAFVETLRTIRDAVRPGAAAGAEEEQPAPH